MKLSVDAEARIEQIMRSYPKPQSAVMPALHIAQEELGFIGDEAIEWVAERTGVAPVRVKEVSSFFTMYYKQEVGRYHIRVCRTVSCALRGSKKIVGYLKTRLGLRSGEISKEGLWSFEEVECLGACGSGPACMINDCCFENLSDESLDAIIKQIEKDRPDLRFSPVRDSMGAGIVRSANPQAVRES